MSLVEAQRVAGAPLGMRTQRESTGEWVSTAHQERRCRHRRLEVHKGQERGTAKFHLK